MKQDEISGSDKTGCQIKKKGGNDEDKEFWSGKRDSNSRPRPWQGRALPTELFPQRIGFIIFYFQQKANCAETKTD